MPTTGGSGDAYDAGVATGPAEAADEVARAERLVAEARYAAERMQAKVAKAEAALEDAKAAQAESDAAVERAGDDLTEARRQRRDGGQE